VFKSSFAASCAETCRNAWCNKVSILTRLYAAIHYLMLICNILLCSPCFWITLSVLCTTGPHRSLISWSVIICIWNQQDDVRIISKLGEEDPAIACKLSEQNAQHQVASSQWIASSRTWGVPLSQLELLNQLRSAAFNQGPVAGRRFCRYPHRWPFALGSPASAHWSVRN
jgi:hypothetical protein